MSRILLLVDHKENCRLLADWLQKRSQVICADSREGLQQPFDLGIVDGPALNRLSKEIRTRKEEERPRLLPFILAVSRQDVGLFAQHLWESVDELIISPIDKMELQVRVEVLLRYRHFSSELKLRNEDLEAYFQALTHDLRAPVRAIVSFTKLLTQEQNEKLDPRGRHHLERIRTVSEQMRDLIDTLLDFSRLGRKKITLRTVHLVSIVESVLRNLQEEIEAAGGQVTLRGALPSVQGDPALLKIALNNLLSNALKYVAPGVPPRVTLSASVVKGSCRIQIEDNGVGVPSEELDRIFSPFVRLYGVEEYPGTGLGLSTVRKVIELMGGRVGASSSLGKGSLFWVELLTPEKGDPKEESAESDNRPDRNERKEGP